MSMVPLFLLSLQNAAAAPPNPNFDYSGVPSFDAPADALALRSHSVTLNIGQAFVDVATVSEIRNLTSKTLTTRVLVPRFRQADTGSGAPDFTVTATINGHALALRRSLALPPLIRQGKTVFAHNELEATLYLAPNTTYGLRIGYRLPMGRAGFDRKMRLAGYSLGEDRPIGTLAMSYRTAAKVVFRLPRPNPDLGWQVSPQGAFTKKTNFTPSSELTYVTFYPGGFEDIGK